MQVEALLIEFLPKELPETMNDCIHIVAKLAYMSDIFGHMNELLIKMQYRNENTLTCSNKLKQIKK